jgi:hypothetical protein
MSQKTDAPEFAPGFLWQIVVLTVVALGIVYFSRGVFSGHVTRGVPWDGVSIPITVYPWVLAGGRTIGNGLRAFSGQTPFAVPIAIRAAALMITLISMVVCPTVFLLEWRRRRLSSDVTAGRPPMKIAGIAYSLCGWITIVSGFGLIPVAYVTEATQTSLRHAQTVQESRDEMINELFFISVDAAQYFILPKTLAGGGRTFEGYSIPEKLARTQEASYTVADDKNKATIHGVSLRNPSCTIEVQVDSIGEMRGWTYGGEFR